MFGAANVISGAAQSIEDLADEFTDQQAEEKRQAELDYEQLMAMGSTDEKTEETNNLVTNNYEQPSLAPFILVDSSDEEETPPSEKKPLQPSKIGNEMLVKALKDKDICVETVLSSVAWGEGADFPLPGPADAGAMMGGVAFWPGTDLLKGF